MSEGLEEVEREHTKTGGKEQNWIIFRELQDESFIHDRGVRQEVKMEMI
jgi:hypothetical protein